jgi:hypothetical protein
MIQIDNEENCNFNNDYRHKCCFYEQVSPDKNVYVTVDWLLFYVWHDATKAKHQVKPRKEEEDVQ